MKFYPKVKYQTSLTLLRVSCKRALNLTTSQYCAQSNPRDLIFSILVKWRKCFLTLYFYRLCLRTTLHRQKSCGILPKRLQTQEKAPWNIGWITALSSGFCFDAVNFWITTGSCKDQHCKVFPTLHKKSFESILSKKTRLYGTNTFITSSFTKIQMRKYSTQWKVTKTRNNFIPYIQLKHSIIFKACTNILFEKKSFFFTYFSS